MKNSKHKKLWRKKTKKKEKNQLIIFKTGKN